MIGRCIVDFYCAEARLVVEIDGGGHGERPQIEYDAWRTEALAKRELRVLRFWNTDVLTNIDGVLITIAEALEKRPSP